MNTTTTVSTAGSTIIAQASPIVKSPVSFGIQGVQLATMEDAYRFASAVVKSGFAPKGMDSPEAIFIAIQMGAEVGLTPMASLQNTAVINGRPALYGDAALAVVRASPVFESYKEEEIGERGKDTWGFRVTSKRRGGESMTEEFTVADAKLAKLWGKQGPWTEYPKRMLKFRARGFNLRDNFGDVLKGLRTLEELQDMPPEPKNVTPPRGLAEALDAPKEPPAQVPEAKTVRVPESAPQKERTAPAPNRQNVILGIEAHLMALAVSEEEVWKWACDVWPEECEACEHLFNLPTEILVKIKEAVPGIAKAK